MPDGAGVDVGVGEGGVGVPGAIVAVGLEGGAVAVRVAVGVEGMTVAVRVAVGLGCPVGVGALAVGLGGRAVAVRVAVGLAPGVGGDPPSWKGVLVAR